MCNKLCSGGLGDLKRCRVANTTELFLKISEMAAREEEEVLSITFHAKIPFLDGHWIMFFSASQFVWYHHCTTIPSFQIISNQYGLA